MAWATVAIVLAFSALTQAPPNCDDSSKYSPLAVTMTTSQKMPSAGKPPDVLVHIKNVSARRVTVDEVNTQPVVPEALSNGDSPVMTCSYFPSVYSDDHLYRLEPNDETYMVCRPRSKSWYKMIKWELSNYFAFQPGDSELVLALQYQTGLKDAERHIETVEITVPVAAPQSVILSGALIGGLCAYLLLLLKRSAGELRFWREISNALLALVLSAVVTILFARVSEAQFLVKVSAEDLWGAIAVGFIASYIGNGVFDRLLGGSGAGAGTSGGQTLPKHRAAEQK